MGSQTHCMVGPSIHIDPFYHIPCNHVRQKILVKKYVDYT